MRGEGIIGTNLGLGPYLPNGLVGCMAGGSCVICVTCIQHYPWHLLSVIPIPSPGTLQYLSFKAHWQLFLDGHVVKHDTDNNGLGSCQTLHGSVASCVVETTELYFQLAKFLHDEHVCPEVGSVVGSIVWQLISRTQCQQLGRRGYLWLPARAWGPCLVPSSTFPGYWPGSHLLSSDPAANRWVRPDAKKIWASCMLTQELVHRVHEDALGFTGHLDAQVVELMKPAWFPL